jgi:diguanylate cyclase (GGDEF)-like protein
LFLFYLVNIITAIFLFKRNSYRKYYLDYQIQGLQEKLNLLKDDNLREHQNTSALKEKIARYNSLKEIIEEINQNLDLEAVSNSLAQIAFSAVSKNKGVCVLYLVDPQTQKLTLFKTKKEDKNLIIRAKEGDIFDFWVSRHARPLLVEDIKKDFRFDPERLRGEEERRISSLISSPFISEEKFIGILRLDNEEPHFYSQDDLRFLVTVSDLGAVAIENSYLFKHTQDLAIHDALTSLYTKGYFLERIKEEFKRASRKNAVFSLLMLDIDLFKNYNDKFGHTAGDIVLKKLSQTINETLSDSGFIASRFGGEEFCVILVGMGKKEACETAERLRERVEKEKIVLRRQETSVSVSIGVATFPQNATSEEELIHKADKAMYSAKQKGRNRVCCI